ncbi:hypothetical protein TNCV_3724251 [Trichonephila clavipes]|nr:hypothetical protein TNCV_3724251 [Trichonephila clavipes]
MTEVSFCRLKENDASEQTPLLSHSVQRQVSRFTLAFPKEAPAVPFESGPSVAPFRMTPEVQQLLESEDIPGMDWPAFSLDLNPLERVWDAFASTPYDTIASSGEQQTIGADAD